MENVQGGRSMKMKSVDNLTLKQKTTYLFESIPDKKYGKIFTKTKCDSLKINIKNRVNSKIQSKLIT